MSTLTKILVVVFVVLAIFASTVFIRHAVDPVNYKLYAESQVQLAQLNAAQAAKAGADLSLLQAQYDNLSRDRNADAATLRAEIARLEELTSTLRSNLATAETTVAGLTAAVQTAEGAQADSLAMLKVTQGQLEQALAGVRTMNLQISKLEEHNKQLSRDLEQSIAVARHQTERVADLEQQLSDLRSGGASTPTAVAAGPQQQIAGTVQAVDGNLAQLNVGSAVGIRQGMRFIVYRGQDFVAHLDIEVVGPSSASGVLVDVQRTPQQGDKAVTATR